MDRTDICILTTCSIYRFVSREQLLKSYPPAHIDQLIEESYLGISTYGHLYNTKKASQFFRQFFKTYSPMQKAPQMVELLKNAHEYVVVDLETTGGSAVRGDRIVEIAALKIRDGHEIDRFHRFINPEIPIKNSHIHGITNERVRHEQTIGPVIEAFHQFLGALPIVSHHIGFDWYNFLALELFRNGIRPSNPTACTVLLARKYLKSPKNNLNVIAKFYNIPLLHHHTADADAVCCNDILQLILSKQKVD